jgi:hypothetical protein
MRSITCIGVAVAALSLSIAACGGNDEQESGGGGTNTAAQSDQEKVRDAAVKFAQCMRENGVENFPDPDANGGTRIQVGPESGIEPEDMEAAQKECEHLQEDIRPQMSEADQTEFKEKALEHARCMREHGIDFPDPQFSGEGKVTMAFKKGEVDPDDPDFKAAQEECGGAGGGIGIGGPGGTP